MKQQIQIHNLTQNWIINNSDEALSLIHSVNGSSEWTDKILLSYLQNNWDLNFIATSENELAGILIAYISSSLNPFLINQKHILLRRLVVTDDYRGQKIGIKLLKKLALTLKNEFLIKFPKIEIIAWQTNKLNVFANNYFNQLGFFQQGKIEFKGKEDIIYWEPITTFLSKLGIN